MAVVATRRVAGTVEALLEPGPAALEDPQAHEFYTVAGAFALRDVLESFEPDWVVSAGFMRILEIGRAHV